MTAAGQRFSRGDHLRVFRAGYFHHGVYDRDDRVFEFGGRIWDKPNARIRTVSLSEFERNGTATLVRHPSRTIVGLLPRAVPPDEIIQRAEFLSEMHTAESIQPSGLQLRDGGKLVRVWWLLRKPSDTDRLPSERGLGRVRGDPLGTPWVSVVMVLGSPACCPSSDSDLQHQDLLLLGRDWGPLDGIRIEA